MKKLLKICINSWDNASRDKRELSVCRELGADVEVLAKGGAASKGEIEDVAGFRVHRFTTRPLGTKVPNGLNRIVSIPMWAHFARKLAPDVISGHDLSGLTIGWLSNLLRLDKALLVYDSHEFEIGRNAKRNFVQIRFIKAWEGFLMKRCAFSIVVNDSIADELTRIHNLDERPVVVRNIPEKWHVNESACAEVRAQLLAEMSGGVL